MENRFTTGPWAITEGQDFADYDCYMIVCDEGKNNDFSVACLYGPDAKANASLIASAPELLEALQDVLQLVNVFGLAEGGLEKYRKAQSAINKATNTNQ
jgi:hypothetical protein